MLGKAGKQSRARPTSLPCSAGRRSFLSEDSWQSHWLPRARGLEPDSGDAGWYFTGRRQLLNDLVSWLGSAFIEDRRQRASVTVVTGAPGTGKSALLAHLVALSVPGLVPQEFRDWLRDVRLDLVSVAVHGRGLDLGAVVGEIAAAIGSSVRDPTLLIQHVNTRGPSPRDAQEPAAHFGSGHGVGSSSSPLRCHR